MTPALTRRDYAIERAQRERDALLQAIADLGLSPAARHALEHHTHLLHDAVHLVVTMGDETVYPALMTKMEET